MAGPWGISKKETMMGYFSDASLDYTSADAELDRLDGLTPPSAPVKYAERWTTPRQIVISWYDGDALTGRTFYQRTADGAASASRKLARLAAQGYTLRP